MSRRFFGRGGGYASESSDGITRNQFAGQHDTVGGVFGIGSQQPLDDPLRRLDAEFAWMGVPMGEEKMIRKHFRLVETENADLIGTAQAMGGGECLGGMLSSLVFGFAQALGIKFSAVGLDSNLASPIPYAVTIIGLVIFSLVRRSRAKKLHSAAALK